METLTYRQDTAGETAEAQTVRKDLKGFNKRQTSAVVKENIIGFAFIAPAVLLFLVFTVIPLVMSFVFSFADYNLVNRMEMIGFDNYTRLFADSVYWTSLWNALCYALMFVPLVVLFSLVTAAMLNSKLFGTKLFRVLFYLPSLTSAVAAAFVWQWLMNPAYGLLNSMLNGVGLPDCPWLTDKSTALFSIVLINLWGAIGGNMIVYMTAFQKVPGELYEAAKIDGAGAVKRFWYVTIPMLRATTYFTVTMSLIGAFQLFDQVNLLTTGGPELSTTTPVYQIYITAFGSREGGYASAMAVILFFIIMAITFVTQKFMKETY